MSIKLVTDQRIAETSSKGNQEKWLDPETNHCVYCTKLLSFEPLSKTGYLKNFLMSNYFAMLFFTYIAE